MGALLPRAHLPSRYVRFCCIGMLDTEVIIRAGFSLFAPWDRALSRHTCPLMFLVVYGYIYNGIEMRGGER